MNDYSDILQVIGAMLLVTLLVQSANRTKLANSQLLLEGEYEASITALAQEIIEESRSLAFDETTVTGFVPVNIPADFSSKGVDAGEDSADRTTFDDFDDFDGWSATIDIDNGSFDVSTTVEYIDDGYNVVVANSTLKAMYVTITNPFLLMGDRQTLKSYNFRIIRSYYAE